MILTLLATALLAGSLYCLLSASSSKKLKHYFGYIIISVVLFVLSEGIDDYLRYKEGVIDTELGKVRATKIVHDTWVEWKIERIKE